MLDDQGRQLDGAPSGQSAVQQHELAHEDRDRPAVGDEMVAGERQHMLTLAHPDERPANGRGLRELERTPGLLSEAFL
jgi:hypothetical protein